MNRTLGSNDSPLYRALEVHHYFHFGGKNEFRY